MTQISRAPHYRLGALFEIPLRVLDGNASSTEVISSNAVTRSAEIRFDSDSDVEYPELLPQLNRILIENQLYIGQLLQVL